MAGGTLRLEIRTHLGAITALSLIRGLADVDAKQLVIAAVGPGGGAACQQLAQSVTEELLQSDPFPGAKVSIEAQNLNHPETDGADAPRSLLIAISPDGLPWQELSWQSPWLTESEDRSLPALPLTSVQQTAQIFSGRLGKINAVFWRNSIAEIRSAVLTRLGLSPERPRIFISYRRAEAQALADQLFGALAERNFDVFLDCFRVPPGIDFQRRLRQELGDKSVVLVLETAHILDSEWTRYEIDTARDKMLGLIALQLPGGVSVPSIDDSRRIRLTSDALIGTGSAAELAPARIPGLMTDIIAEHDAALRRRLSLLRQSVVISLSNDGWTVNPSGAAIVSAQDPHHREWQILVCSRPPELTDFHTAYQHLGARAGNGTAVVGLTALLEPTASQPLIWLSALSKYPLIDTTEIAQLGSKLRGLGA